MNTKEFIENISEGCPSNDEIIDFVCYQEARYLELLHTEIGFLTGLVISVRSGAKIEDVLRKRVIDLRNEAK